MTEARIGRVLAACLHQAILERLPQRLDFYEYWLDSEGLRDGSIGLAAASAVLAFLRTEGEAYDQVVTYAGSLAAEWTIASMPALRRRAIMKLPRPLLARAALRVAAGIARSTFSPSRVATRVRRDTARFDVTDSLFCTVTVREVQTSPLCGFYASVAADTLTRLGVPAVGRVEQCHAVGAPTCVIALDLLEAGRAPGPAIAA